MEKKTAQVAVWLPQDKKLTLKLLADADRRTVSEYVALLIERDIEAAADRLQAIE